MKRLGIILVTFVVVLVLSYGTYTFDKRLDTLEEMIEQTAQEVKDQPRPQIINQIAPTRAPDPYGFEAMERRRTQDRLSRLEDQQWDQRYNESHS